MNKLSFVFLFVFFLSVPFVFSAIEVTNVTSIKDTILQKDEASFRITVHNTKLFSESFGLYSIDQDWILRQEPLFTSLDANETKSFVLYLTAKTGTSPGPKGVDVSIRSEHDPGVVSVPLFIYLSSKDLPPLDYSPSVKIDGKINTDNAIDPRNDVVVKVQLKNRNPLNFTRLDIILASLNINAVRSITLGPFEETTEYFELRVDPTLAPQKDVLSISLKKDNKTFDSVTIPYEVISYSPFFKKESVEKDFFLKYDTTVTLFNTGNIGKEEEYKVPTTWYSRFFYKTTPYAQLRKDDNTLFYVWKVSLAPQASIETEFELAILTCPDFVMNFTREPERDNLPRIENFDLILYVIILSSSDSTFGISHFM